MAKKDELFEKAFEELKQDGKPSKQQKDIMLDQILMECRAENASAFIKLKGFIFQYPWRFAFAVSAIQTVICTIFFGTQYTNLFLGFFGG